MTPFAPILQVSTGVVVTTPGISSLPVVSLTNESIAQLILNMQLQQQQQQQQQQQLIQHQLQLAHERTEQIQKAADERNEQMQKEATARAEQQQQLIQHQLQLAHERNEQIQKAADERNEQMQAQAKERAEVQERLAKEHIEALLFNTEKTAQERQQELIASNEALQRTNLNVNLERENKRGLRVKRAHDVMRCFDPVSDH
jgi:hypothetical protein